MQTISAKSVTEFPDAPDIESSTEDYAGRFKGPIGEWLVEKQAKPTRKAISEHFSPGQPFTGLGVGGGHGQNDIVI